MFVKIKLPQQPYFSKKRQGIFVLKVIVFEDCGYKVVEIYRSGHVVTS